MARKALPRAWDALPARVSPVVLPVSVPRFAQCFHTRELIDPSEGSEVFEGHLKKRGLVMFKSCRTKPSLGTDPLTPNPEFFCEALVQKVLASFIGNNYPSLP